MKWKVGNMVSLTFRFFKPRYFEPNKLRIFETKKPRIFELKKQKNKKRKPRNPYTFSSKGIPSTPSTSRLPPLHPGRCAPKGPGTRTRAFLDNFSNNLFVHNLIGTSHCLYGFHPHNSPTRAPRDRMK